MRPVRQVGGTVLIGGDYQGSNPDIKNAQRTAITSNVTINADAVTNGDGGEVIVWADEATRYYGNVSARGGSESGDGGFVEISGKISLAGEFVGRVDTTAANGEVGTLLLDPTDIVISDGSGDSADDDDASNASFIDSGGSNTAGTLLEADTPATFNLFESELEGIAATTNIVLQASNNITINDLSDNNLNLAQTGGNSVTFTADSDGDNSGDFIMNTGDTITTAGGALNISGENVTLGAINTNGGALTVGGVSAINIGGSITTTGATQAYTGPVNVTATASLIASSHTFSSTINLNANTLTLENTGTTTISTVISGTGNLTKDGVGTLNLGGTNTYTGTTTINGGTLELGAANVLADASSLVIANSSVFDLGANSDTVAGVQLTNGSIQNGTLTSTSNYDLRSGTVSAVLAGAVGLDKSTAGTVILSSAGNTYTGATSVTGGSLRISQDDHLGAAPGVATPGSLTLNGGTLETTATFTLSSNRGISLAGAGTFDVDAATTLTYGGIIAGAGSLAKSDTGTLSLTGANTYSGSTTLTAGTISIGTDSGLGAAPGSATAGHLVFNGGTLLTTVGFTLNANRGIDLQAGGGTIDVGAGTLNYGGIIAGSGALNKAGANTLTLTGTNTYSGTTTISAGTLNANLTDALGDGSATNTLIFNGGTLQAGGIINSPSMRGVTMTSTGIIDTNGQAIDFDGVISGAGGLTKTGAGTLDLSGANTYAGLTTVSTGTLRIANDTALGATSGDTTVSSGATLALQGGSNVAAGESLTISGSGSGGVGALTNAAGVNSYAGDITLGAAATIGSQGGTITVSGGITNAGFDLTVNGAGNTTISTAAISGTGGIIKDDAGTLTLSFANTYTGTTTINTGTVAVTANDALGTNAAGTTVNSGGTLDVRTTYSTPKH